MQHSDLPGPLDHSDPDVLALLALGEPAPPSDTAHVEACPQCREEVAALARVVSTVRAPSASDADALVAAQAGPPVPPPPRVWEAIAARTGVAVAPRPSVVAAGGPGDAGAEPLTGPTPPAGSPPAESPPVPLRRGGRPDRRAVPAPSRGRWSPRARTLTLAVAASLLVGAAAGSLATHALSSTSTPPATTQVIAQVALTNLQPRVTSASGRATVVETKAGPRLEVDVAALRPQAGHFYEVWLIDSSITKMVPVGILVPGDDVFVIPDGVDLSQYPIVDISVQQPGDPKHSGDSVLRGTISG